MAEPIKIQEERPLRVLVEAPAPWNFAVKEVRSLPGVEAIYCPGPALHADVPCPVLVGQKCWRADTADVIVAGLGIATAEGSAIVRGLREQHPDTPIVLLVWRTELMSGTDVMEGCETVVFPWTTRKVSAAIAQALGRVPAPA